MRIVSPIDHLGEAQGLLDAGADELYGGYVPATWRERFSLLASLNQRTFDGAQLESADELAEIVALTRSQGKRFSLTLNAPYYTDAQYPLLMEVVDQAVAAGINGIILADLGLLRTLRRRHPQLEYHASTLAHLSNSAAIAFFQTQGISRAILPRHLTVAEMGEILTAAPTIPYDAFLLVGKCPNTEGLCTFHHSSPDQVWPCELPYLIEPQTDGDPSPQLKQAMKRQGSWSCSDRRHGCGLCALPQLARIGIDGLKLVGRGAPAHRKLANVRLVREFIELSVAEPDFEIYRDRARAAHQRHFNAPCSRNVCYYPEFFPDDL